MAEILDIAKKYLQRVRNSGGDNIVALCPFHDDNSPSFAMNTQNGLYICYGCGAKGNLRQFLEAMGLGPEEIRRGYRSTLEEARKNSGKTKLDPTKPGVIMTDEAPLKEELLGLFMGYPKALLEKGFSEKTLDYHEVGFDKYHNSITYPIRDLAGNLVGISGRRVEGEDFRYKVYDKEYLVWGLPERDTKKSKTLWGGHLLRNRVQRSGFSEGNGVEGAARRVVVVEGYKAKMWVHQSGISEVVALHGSKLSQAQKWILERWGLPVVLMLDNDETGYASTVAIGRELLKSLPVKLALYEGDQPDDVSPDKVRESIENAVDYHQVWLNSEKH